jgi:threonine aldolase
MTTTNSLCDFSIDLRSDTVTRPTSEMRAEMTRAISGDDVFAEDPEINALQEKCAEMFSMEAGLYCPSGTMTNQIAISVHTSPGDEVICSSYSHIYHYEGAGIARLSGASVKLLEGDRGMFTSVDVEAAINPNDSHYARTSLVCLEDTCNKGGGSIWDIEEIKKVSKAARSAGLAVHLDGARLWNAIVARGVHRDSASLSSYASNFDSISLCLSEGLGCPVGSVLLGSKSFIAEAHRVRKVLGGGMRQAGIVASAGTYAIEHHLDRLAEDHSRALALGEAALQHPSVKSHAPIDTNIVIIELEDGVDAAGQVEVWAKKGIKCFPFSRTSIRFVTHLDITDAEVEEACRILKTN